MSTKSCANWHGEPSMAKSFFFWLGAQNLIFFGPQFRYDFEKFNFSARLGGYPLRPLFLLFFSSSFFSSFFLFCFFFF